MAVVDVDGVPIHYEVDGPPAGPPVLVLHGGLGLDHVVYRRTLEPLVGAGFRLVHFDQRANGRSVPADLATLTMERLADDAVGLVNHLGLDRFAVLGHSYGGFVAQELALRHPERVAAMVLVDTTPGQLGTGEIEDEHGIGPAPPPEVIELMSAAPATDDEFASAMADLLPAYFHRPAELDLAAMAEGTVFRVAVMERGFEVLAAWSSVDRLSDVRIPTLVVVGRHDVFTAWPQAHRIASRVPGAEIAIFEESGHFPWIEEPDRFFALVGDFLS